MQTAIQQRAYRYQELEVEVPVSVKTGAWQFLLLLTIALSATLAFVWLTSQTESIEKNIMQLRNQTAVQASEVQNLRTRAERYRGGRYITAAVRRFNLDLQEAHAGQIRRMTVDGELETPRFPNVVATND